MKMLLRYINMNKTKYIRIGDYIPGNNKHEDKRKRDHNNIHFRYFGSCVGAWQEVWV